MPALPGITVLARELQEGLTGKTIDGIEVLQPKCPNLPEAQFRTALTGAQILNVTSQGTWLRVGTTKG